ncbi:MAG: protoporphyrinogen oxidase, partial [Nitrospinota bacterium]
EDMIKMVKGELKDIMGIDADPILARLYRWKKAMPQYTIGHDERLTILNRMLSKEHGLFLTGSAYRGIGISGCINDADLTADAVIKHFYPAQ